MAAPGGDDGGVHAPEPAYENDEHRALAARLEKARARRADLMRDAESTAEVDAEILDLRRRLREGGQVRAGDTLDEGRYKLIRRLGRGGFASVWKAFDRARREHVAIKVLHPVLAGEGSRRERFFRGARVMAKLSHPAVVRVRVPEGEDHGFFYFVMDLVEGEDLHHAVIGKRFSKERAVPLILRIGEALGEAHAQGMVHRDVKPANVLLDREGEAFLTDFDLAADEDTTGGTGTGVLGTMLFAAPDNAKDTDPRADVYGLGMTAIFCLHGATLPEHTLRKPELVIASLSCGPEVKAVLTKAIELKREDRFEDAKAFCEALQAASAAGGEARGLAYPSSSLDRMSGQRVADIEVEESVAEEIKQRAIRLQRAEAREATRARLLAIGASVSVLGGASALFYIVSGPPSPRHPVETAIASATIVAPTSVPAASAALLCPENMVPIPGGTFTMGSADGEADEKPPHQVKVSAFCLDKTEVTVAAYRQCTKEERNGVRCAAAPTTVKWDGADVPFWSQFCNGDKSEKDTHPINCVDWTHADAYCKWAGGRLPTEAQWEYAARGTDGRKYPWGNDKPGSKLLNACGGECRMMANRIGKTFSVMYDEEDGAEATSPVGKYPDGASPYGALDMAGNVWEWVADWYAPYPAEGKAISEDPTGPDKPVGESRRVIRGGGWDNSDAPRVRAAYRNRNYVSLRGLNVGFRCARGQQ